MSLSMSYVLIYGLAGFASAAYAIKVGERVKYVPLIALVCCTLFSLSNFGFMYGFLTVIEFAIGFGIAHAFIKPNQNAGSGQESERL